MNDKDKALLDDLVHFLKKQSELLTYMADMIEKSKDFSRRLFELLPDGTVIEEGLVKENGYLLLGRSTHTEENQQA